MMLKWHFVVPAFILEAASWIYPFHFSGSNDLAFLSYVLLHAAASVLFAFSLYPALNNSYNRPRWAVLLLITCFSFILPIIGWATIIYSTKKINNKKLNKKSKNFPTTSLPEFDFYNYFNSLKQSLGMRALLSNPRIPEKNRFSALVSLTNVSGHLTSPILRDALNDPNEEIRLLAYAMLDRMEQKISKSIHEQYAILHTEAECLEKYDTHPNTRYLIAARRLSDLYWEMIYQGLATDDTRDFYIHESLRYCEIALQSFPNDAALVLRRGRLAHMLGQHEIAKSSYEQAIQHGIPPTKVIPYLAQLYFEAGNYQQVKNLIRSIPSNTMLPKLRPVIDLWSHA